MTINKIHKGEDEKAPSFSQTAITKDSSESASQVISLLETIDTVKLAAAGFAREATAISAARVKLDFMKGNKR